MKNVFTSRRANRHLCVAPLLLMLLVAPRPAQAGMFSVSPEKERRLGEEAARQIESQARVVRGPVADWIGAIGQRLAAVSSNEFKYSFKVIDSPEINAFCLPGGYVYVCTGLRKVAQTDDEVAAVIAHEITHAEQHHYAKQYGKASKRGALLSVLSIAAGLPSGANQVLGLLDLSMSQKYSRTQEAESDDLGMKRLARAGFKPQGMVSLLEKLSKEDGKSNVLDKWFGDHPGAAQRVAAAQQELLQLRAAQMQGDATVKPQFGPWNDAVLGAISGNLNTGNTNTNSASASSDAAKKPDDPAAN